MWTMKAPDSGCPRGMYANGTSECRLEWSENDMTRTKRDMSIDPRRGLILVFLVQHAGFPGNGDKSHSAFREAAERGFGDMTTR